MLINFDNVSNEELRDGALRLRKLERESEADLLLYMREFEKRDLALHLGYSSLFLYLVKALGYPEACASRRIRISRLVSKYPEIINQLKSGASSLSSLNLIAGVLEKTTEELGNKLLAEISNKTCEEVSRLGLAYKPESPRPKEYIKPIKVFVNSKPVVATTDIGKNTDQDEAKDKNKEGNLTNLFCNLQECSKAIEETVESEIRYEVRCSLSRETKAKLSKAQSLMVHKLKGDMALENVFNELIDCYLAKHSNPHYSSDFVMRVVSV